VAAVKVGALCAEEHIDVLADALAGVSAPVVLDPVFAPTAGAAFITDVARWRERLLPLATVITPNRHELARLAGMPVDTPQQAIAAAQALGGAVFITGGHFPGEAITEWLVMPAAAHTFRKPRLDLIDGPGTGCALSTALACRLALGAPLPQACGEASVWVSGNM